MVGADFMLKIRIQETETPGIRGLPVQRNVSIHIDPVSIDSPPDTVDYAYRFALRFKRMLELMPTPCEVTITGKGVPQ